MKKKLRKTNIQFKIILQYKSFKGNCFQKKKKINSKLIYGEMTPNKKKLCRRLFWLRNGFYEWKVMIAQST